VRDKALSNLDREIIMAFAKYDMKPYRVSQNIYLAKGTIMYHVKKIKQITGLDIRKFYELCELIEVMDEY
jgi:sugar diacid utilization regulator